MIGDIGAPAAAPRRVEAIDVLPLVWYDGEIVDAADVALPPMTHALHFGTSVFDGVRGYDEDGGLVLFRLQDHAERLERSARAYGIEMPVAPAALAAAVVELCTALRPRDCYVRPICWFGHGTLSLAPYRSAPVHLMVMIVPLGNYFGGANDGPRRGLRLTVSGWRKSSSRSLPSWVKCGGHYANSVLATSDAVRAGFDEALMLNERGDVAEGSCENVFLVRDGTLITNDVDADILPGITRATVCTLAERLAIPLEIRPIALADVERADEIFLTGTAAEVAPVDEVDGRRYRSSAPDSLTSRIASAYADASRGRAQRDLGWCTHVAR